MASKERIERAAHSLRVALADYQIPADVIEAATRRALLDADSLLGKGKGVAVNIEEILSLVQAGEPYTSVASKLGTSPSKVQKVASAAGIYRREQHGTHTSIHWTPEERSTLAACWRAGWTDKAIGRRLGRSTHSVTKQRLRRGWTK